MKSIDIDELIDDVIAREGGYVDHPADRGGATRWGITEAVARRRGYVGDMRALPRSDAAAIYRGLYWIAPAFDRIAKNAPKLAAKLFDMGVNIGTGAASGFLQRCLNALNRQARDYPEITVDRSVGPSTLRALAGFLKLHPQSGEAVLLKAVEALQGAHYVRLAEAKPSQDVFVYGWLANRIGKH